MGKRSNKKRMVADLYETFDDAAVIPLIPHLPKKFTYVSPCCGNGELINNIARHMPLARPVRLHDLYEYGIDQKDATTYKGYACSDFFLENPPWTRHILHAIIENLSDQRPTWLLFDADWAHTVQKNMANKHGVKTVPELLKRCVKIVSVGRVKWIKNTTMKGKDNCAWYLFDKNHCGPTEFHGRT